eukprot:CAMPEP_0117585282 /NCGR_PEP_ID=MMETSP0784-20121206/68058_1 /TAXON_ID=39447 /ORGANISM="" /LENGTH=281 /DNA_ID=CAMNT_0005386211 /DNA_START=66 /DNA_END=910 /DNA_ORIENTATION=+
MPPTEPACRNVVLQQDLKEWPSVVVETHHHLPRHRAAHPRRKRKTGAVSMLPGFLQGARRKVLRSQVPWAPLSPHRRKELEATFPATALFASEHCGIVRDGIRRGAATPHNLQQAQDVQPLVRAATCANGSVVCDNAALHSTAKRVMLSTTSSDMAPLPTLLERTDGSVISDCVGLETAPPHLHQLPQRAPPFFALLESTDGRIVRNRVHLDGTVLHQRQHAKGALPLVALLTSGDHSVKYSGLQHNAPPYRLPQQINGVLPPVHLMKPADGGAVHDRIRC